MRSRHAAIQAGAGSRLTRMRLTLALVMVALLSACAPQFRDHGYIPPESELARLQVGVDTRESVIAAVGAPTIAGVLGDDDFYYVQSRFQHVGFLAPEEIERSVLAISFTPAGTLANIERFGLQDGRVVALSRRVTVESVRDTTFIRQLLGNIGRLDAETLFGE